MKEEKVKEIKQNAESLKNANGDTVVKIAAEINKNENTTDQTENATDTVDKLNGKKEKGKKTTEEDSTQLGADLVLLDEPNLRNEYLDCMKYLLTQITDFGFQQEEEIGRSIISHTKYRLKDRESIIAKMVKKKRELTEENVFTYINDLAGIRVIPDTWDFHCERKGFCEKTEKQWLSESARNRAVYRWKKSRNSAADDWNGFLVGAGISVAV